jgi:hypothetical protein
MRGGPCGGFGSAWIGGVPLPLLSPKYYFRKELTFPDLAKIRFQRGYTQKLDNKGLRHFVPFSTLRVFSLRQPVYAGRRLLLLGVRRAISIVASPKKSPANFMWNGMSNIRGPGT